MIVLSNVVAPTDGIRLIQGQVAAHIDDETAGEGELIVAERYIIFVIFRINRFPIPGPSAEVSLTSTLSPYHSHGEAEGLPCGLSPMIPSSKKCMKSKLKVI